MQCNAVQWMQCNAMHELQLSAHMPDRRIHPNPISTLLQRSHSQLSSSFLQSFSPPKSTPTRDAPIFKIRRRHNRIFGPVYVLRLWQIPAKPIRVREGEGRGWSGGNLEYRGEDGNWVWWERGRRSIERLIENWWNVDRRPMVNLYKIYRKSMPAWAYLRVNWTRRDAF